jgi:type II pantothenate kinase
MYLFFLLKELRKVYDRYHAQATGGGAYKFADDFLEKGVCLDKLDEMDSVVSGATFYCKSVSVLSCSSYHPISLTNILACLVSLLIYYF